MTYFMSSRKTLTQSINPVSERRWKDH